MVIAAAAPDQAFSPERQSKASETTAPNICVTPNASRMPAQNGVFRSFVCIIRSLPCGEVASVDPREARREDG